MIVYLAVRLLVRHRHGHDHRHRVRRPLTAFGIGLVHGMGGSAGVGVLLLAAIPSKPLAVASLGVLAVFPAVSMTIVTTGFGAGLAVRRIGTATPAIGLASLAFGFWYPPPRGAMPIRSRIADMAEPLNVLDYARLAEEALEPGAFGYFAGAPATNGRSPRTQRRSRALRLRPRVLVDRRGVRRDDGARDAGLDAAPRRADGDPAHGAPGRGAGHGRAAAAAGTIMCLSTLATATPAEVADAAPGAPRWFQLYVFRDRGLTRHLVAQAVAAGFSAIVLTVDAPRLGRRERDLRTGFRIPPEVVVPSFAEAAGSGAERRRSRSSR